MRNCLYCGRFTVNSKYCNNTCAAYITGKINGKKAAMINKKNSTGFFGMTKKEHKNAGLRSARLMKKNKTGFYDPKIQSMGGIYGSYINKINKTGLYDERIRNKGRKLSHITMIKNKIGIFDPKVRLKAIESLRRNKKIKLYGLYFDSNFEKEIALNLLKQHYIKKLNYRKNVHVKVGIKEVDFLINRYRIIIEPHCDCWSHGKEDYYKQRRSNLDKNGYKDYKLIVIT